ncbi:hydrophobin, partial [Cyathus striatus]
QCNNGTLTCCNSVQAADSPAAIAALKSVGAAVQGVTGQVGLTCSAPTVIGASGNSCSQQPVCCTNNNFNGVVAIGCTPVNVNL